MTGASSALRTRPDIDGRQDATAALVGRLRTMSLRGLARMYDAPAGNYVFRVRRTPAGTIVKEGHSPRYTAITLIGLATERAHDAARATGPQTREGLCARLLEQIVTSQNLGDVALAVWAGALLPEQKLEPAARRLAALEPATRVHPVVELAWTLTALTLSPAADVARLRDAVAERLMNTFNPTSLLFPHVAGANGSRSHVSCFADLIYPIQALAIYARIARNQRALDMASACAGHLCSLQGEAGQWWWHYDYRTGRVLEKYPVYAIHQDAMGPMGLFALRDAKGLDCTEGIARGLRWLAAAPELGGRSLIDEAADLIWRKVARHEPRKAARYLQAAVSRIHSSLRVPGIDHLFPAGMIDYEDRPYHLGWLLHAWPAERVAQFTGSGEAS